MRHNNKINALGRKSAHRKAMLSNMATSLIMHKRIKTTVAKAKALRIYIEPIITKSKEDTTHSRRLAFGYLQDKNAVAELFREVTPKVLERPGGYTRILKIGKRSGDAADMCFIELVDFNETMLAAKVAEETKATRRSRRGSKKKSGDVSDTSAKTEKVVADKLIQTTESEDAVPESEAEEKETVSGPKETADIKVKDEKSEPEAENRIETEASSAEVSSAAEDTDEKEKNKEAGTEGDQETSNKE